MIDKEEERRKLGIEAIYNIYENQEEAESIIERMDEDDLSELGDAEFGGILDTDILGRTLSNQTIESMVADMVAEANPDLTAAEAQGNIFALATEQAFKEVSSSSNAFTRVCADFFSRKYDTDRTNGSLAACIGGALDPSRESRESKKIRELFDLHLDQLSICGLFDFAVAGIECLFSGLTF